MSDINPSLFAYFALLIWPVAALYLFSRLSIGQALMWTILGGYLLLPIDTGIKFKMIPTFNKESIPNLAALIGCALYARRLPKFFRGFGLAEVLIISILIGPFITSMLNTDPIQIGDTFLPGVGAYDAGSAAIFHFISILPFFLGRQFLRSAEDNANVLRVMVIAGLAYSLLMLLEVRMAPQLHTWLYGNIGSSIFQELREGSFRPVVFLENGLMVAFFAMTTVVAAAALWRTRSRVGRLPLGGIVAYMSFILVLCRTASALMYGAVLVPLVRWASPRMQLRVASVLVIIALAYPMLRVVDVFPTNAIVQVAQAVSTDRAASLNSRFVQEHQLLERAWERPWFGWGRYGRSRVYEGWMGADSSITDGYWIILLGTFGVFGFAVTFGLFGLAVLRAATALKFTQTTREAVYLAALAFIVAINIVDLLPNASISPWLWLLVGTLFGRTEALRSASRQEVRVQDKSFLVGRSTT